MTVDREQTKHYAEELIEQSGGLQPNNLAIVVGKLVLELLQEIKEAEDALARERIRMHQHWSRADEALEENEKLQNFKKLVERVLEDPALDPWTVQRLKKGLENV